jgi:N-acetylmuramoyl-L-alanine amidase
VTGPRVNRPVRRRVALAVVAIVLLGVAAGAIATRNRGNGSRRSAIVTPTTVMAKPAVATTTTRVVTTTAPSTTAPSTTIAPSTTAAPTAAPTVAPTAPPTSPPTTQPTVAPAVGAGSGSLAALRGRTIAIDPGHDGGNYAHTSEISRPVFIGTQTRACDTTGTATDDGYSEAAYTLDVALRLRAVLQSAGANVVMTRTTNDGWGPCIDQRAAIGNNAHAAAAISIHADGGPASGRGFHVLMPALVPGYTDDIYSSSHRLGLAVRDAFVATGMPTSTYYATQGLAERTDLGGLNLSNVPKVFIETGNMRNATDASMLESSDFRQRAARQLAVGLDRFLAA